MTRFCKDCRYAYVDSFIPPHRELQDYHYQCRHPSAVRQGTLDLVTGKQEADYYSTCSACRVGTANPAQCGKDGRFWEPRTNEDDDRR